MEYRGFDHNDPLEGRMAGYVKFLMRDEGVWDELRPQLADTDRGNSHSPKLEVYQRMLAEYGRIMHSRSRGYGPHSYLLDAEELQTIADASVHPSNR